MEDYQVAKLKMKCLKQARISNPNAELGDLLLQADVVYKWLNSEIALEYPSISKEN